MLREAGAHDHVQNNDGHPAILGIDGNKVGVQAWDSPMTMLKASDTLERLESTFAALEAMSSEARAELDKAHVIQIGMSKKKALKDVWDHARFMVFAKKL